MPKPIICASAIGLFLLTVSALQSPAQIGTALSFDGTNDFVRPSTNAFTNVINNFTIEAWVRPAAARSATAETTNGVSGTSAQRYAVFPDQGDATYGAGHAGAGISVGTNGISVFEHAANYLASPLVYEFATTGWTHVAVVYLNQQPSLYVNGALARTGLTSTKTVHPSAGLGENGQGYGYFSGQLDEFRVWNVARAASEIRSNMFSVLSGGEPGLVVNYHFNEGTGLTTADSAALNGNTTGNLSNGVAWVTSSAPAGGLSVTMADSLLIDTNGNGKPSAGDTIRYTITIQNSGTNTLTNVVLNVPATPNNTLVAGSVKLPPRAVDDGPATNSSPGQPFHGAFNVALNISAPGLLANDTTGGTGGIASFGGGSFPGTATTTAAGSSANAPVVGTLTVNANGSVVFTPAATFNGLATFQYRLTNAIGASIATATLAIGVRPSATGETYLVTGNVRINTANIPQSVLANDVGDGLVISASTTPANGTVAFAAGGHFVYTPNRGFTGPDSFNYTIMNGFGAATATVALNVSNRVWSVDVLGAAGGDGRAHNPYSTLAAFNLANNNVAPNPRTNDVIVVRDGSYAGGLFLTNDQRVVGDGWSGTFAAAAGFALAPGSDFAALSGTDPVFSPPTGNGVNLALNNQLRGLTVSNSVGGFGFAGGAVGNLVVAESSKRGTGGALSVTRSGAFGTNVNFDVLESTSSPGANLFLAAVTGTLGVASPGAGLGASAANAPAVGINAGSVTLNYAGNVAKTNTGSLVNVSNHTGALTFSAAMNASAGDGLQFDNADGTYNFTGTVTLNGGDAGIDIVNGSAGNFTFNNAPITGPTGIAFRVNGGNGTIIHGGPMNKNNAGVAVDIQGRTGGSVTLHSNITASAGAGGILVQNCTGGTITFASPSQSLSTGVNPGVNLVNNSGATIDFIGGGLAITTSSGTGFNATGGGTVNVTGNGNTIGSGTGTALNVVNTTIGAANLNFRGISAGTAASGPAMGINLNHTGISGGLVVTGTGAAGSGGTIQRCTHGIFANTSPNLSLANMNIINNGLNQTLPGSDGSVGGNLRAGNNLSAVANITLFGVTNVSLNNMVVNGSGQMGINGNNVTGFAMTNSAVRGNGNEQFEDGLIFQNLKGNCFIRDTIIKDNASYQIAVANVQSGSTLVFDIAGTRTNGVYPAADTSTTEIGKTVQSNTFTDQSLLLDSIGTATGVNMTLNLSGVVFRNSLPGNSVLINPIAESGTLSGTTTNCSFDNTAGGVIIQAQNGMNGTYNVRNSEFNRVNLQSILYGAANPYNGAFSGTASGNHIGEDQTGTAGEACDPAGGNCNGIQVNFIGGSGSLSALILTNFIQRFGGVGIRVTANGINSPGVSINIVSNRITNPSGLIAHGMDISIGTTANANVAGCLGIAGNTVTGNYEDPGVGVQLGIVTNVRFLSSFRLPGYGGSSTDVGGPGAGVTTFINGNNNAGGKVFTQRGGSGTYPGGAACSTPSQ